jgi:DNA-directed RNA polymerase alpha subunit
MPAATSFADVIRDWERLLAAHTDNAEILTPAEAQRRVLEEFLAKARELKARQESLNAAKQQTTQEITALVKDGREAARRLRSAVKANLGTKNERLTQFKIAPLRERAPRKPKTPAPGPPPADGSTVQPPPEPPGFKFQG